jgi:hypothetical protein
MPEFWLVRELPGLLLTFVYMAVLPPVLGITILKKLREEIGWVRYSIVIGHLLPMAGMVIKMLLRWTVNLKYVVFIPEYFFNI